MESDEELFARRARDNLASRSEAKCTNAKQWHFRLAASAVQLKCTGRQRI